MCAAVADLRAHATAQRRGLRPGRNPDRRERRAVSPPRWWWRSAPALVGLAVGRVGSTRHARRLGRARGLVISSGCDHGRCASFAAAGWSRVGHDAAGEWTRALKMCWAGNWSVRARSADRVLSRWKLSSRRPGPRRSRRLRGDDGGVPRVQRTRWVTTSRRRIRSGAFQASSRVTAGACARRGGRRRSRLALLHRSCSRRRMSHALEFCVARRSPRSRGRGISRRP